MKSGNLGFTGSSPQWVTVEENVQRAIQYKISHSAIETLLWFYNSVRNNSDQHLLPTESMDYKQINRDYADFGNYNYGAVGSALGFPEELLKLMAGWAQGKSDGLDNIDALQRAINDSINNGDNPGDQAWIQKGIDAINSLSPEEKQQLQDMGFIPYDPNSPENYDPTNPGGTSPGGTTPGGGGTSPGGTTPGGGGGTSPNGHPLPYNPETPQPHDPLVLDLNQDGKISTIALADSQVYFDLTGDGVKERVGWIAPEDGLLVYDKNMNGKIDGVSEVFGKDGLSGFAELRAVADTNYDNIIDRRDALFSQLKVWQDTNSDGISQSSELKSLSSAGVKNIELNVIGTNINLEGNLLSEAGRYGDTAGERELAADIQLLATERVNSSTTPSTYTIDPITETLPQMRGYGYIDNSFKAYNLDPKLKELALSFMNDKEHASANFGEFILRWSGFYNMAKSKGISEEQFSPHLYEVPSIKLWILERFVGSKKEAWRTEAHLGENTNGGYHTQDFGNEAYIHEHFNLLMERYEAMFALQAYYTDVFSDTHYDISIDEFVIDDSEAFTTKLTEYLNNAAIPQTDKLYLASMMNNLEGTFLHFDAKTMIDSITDTTLKSTITDIMDEKVHFQFAKESGFYSYDNTHVYGDDLVQMLTINSSGAVSMIAGGGIMFPVNVLTKSQVQEKVA